MKLLSATLSVGFSIFCTTIHADGPKTSPTDVALTVMVNSKDNPQLRSKLVDRLPMQGDDFSQHRDEYLKQLLNIAGQPEENVELQMHAIQKLSELLHAESASSADPNSQSNTLVKQAAADKAAADTAAGEKTAAEKIAAGTTAAEKAAADRAKLSQDAANKTPGDVELAKTAAADKAAAAKATMEKDAAAKAVIEKTAAASTAAEKAAKSKEAADKEASEKAAASKVLAAEEAAAKATNPETYKEYFKSVRAASLNETLDRRVRIAIIKAYGDFRKKVRKSRFWTEVPLLAVNESNIDETDGVLANVMSGKEQDIQLRYQILDALFPAAQ